MEKHAHFISCKLPHKNHPREYFGTTLCFIQIATSVVEKSQILSVAFHLSATVVSERSGALESSGASIEEVKVCQEMVRRKVKVHYLLLEGDKLMVQVKNLQKGQHCSQIQGGAATKYK